MNYINYYLAGGLAAAKQLADLSASIEGDFPNWDCTYRWWENAHLDGYEGGEMAAPPPPAEMGRIARKEIRAVVEADVVLIHLPSAGRGSHVELGAALATSSISRIVLLFESEDDFTKGGYPSVFHNHPAVERVHMIHLPEWLRQVNRG